MTLAEILNAVATKTNRPDLEEEIFLAVQEATLFCHTKDFFKKDLAEIPISHGTSGLFSGQLVTDSILPSFRKIGYWRKYDPVGRVAGDFLYAIEPDDIFDSYRRKKLDVYYMAGKVLNWYSSTVDLAHIIGYYRFPDVSRSRFQSWIADIYPFAIINQAIGDIFRDIGKQEAANSAFNKAGAAMKVIEINEIESNAR